MADTKISAFDDLTTAGINVSDVEGIAAYYDDGGTLTNVRLSGSDIIGVNTNSYMLTGVIANIANANDDFTSFGGTPIPGGSQAGGFQVFQDSQLTHISFKYCSNVSLNASTESYAVTVYESDAGFENLDAEDINNYTTKGTPITITGDGAGSSDYGLYPYVNIDIAAALGSAITLTAGKFYAIIGERSLAGLFPATQEDGQITLRITE